MLNIRNPKGAYTEAEAAEALGISVDDLRFLVRRHIIDSEEDVAKITMTSFQPADLLVLRLLMLEPKIHASSAMAN